LAAQSHDAGSFGDANRPRTPENALTD
jgi:hypothetical protein